jgi:Trk K+ transport system NAD-binding subunit
VETNRLARYYLAVLVGSILLFTAIYDAGMTLFEGRPRTFIDSLEVVMQTYTTVGYGQDAGWESPQMTLLVVVMQATSLLLIFSAFPAIIVPLIEDSLSTTPPTAREDLTDHVVVCNSTTHTEALIDELESRDIPYVILEPDREAAINLYERDVEVVHGDPESMADLERVNVGQARTLVSDADDEVDMSIITSVKELVPELPVYSIAEDTDLAEYHELAGADKVFLPRELLGMGLANKVRNTVVTEFEGGATVGEGFEIGEVPVRSGSELAGRRLTEDGITDRTSARIIGAWSRGRFHTPPFDGLRLDDQTGLLVVGTGKALDSLADLAGSEVRQYGRGTVLVLGFGMVGRTVTDALVTDGIDRTVVDIEDGARVDVVGDVTEEEVLEAAGVREARTVVLALDDDTTTLVSSFVVSNLASDIEIVARVDEHENVAKLYHAGVDYALALSTVAGRLLAAEILESDQSVTLDRQVRLVRREPGALAGKRLDEAAVRERTGATVVAIEHRDGRVNTNLRGWAEISATVHLIVAGLDEALEQLDELL